MIYKAGPHIGLCFLEYPVRVYTSEIYGAAATWNKVNHITTQKI